MRFDRWFPIIAAGMMGWVLSICGFQFWHHWQYWAIFSAGAVWCLAGVRYQSYRGNREAVDEALQKLREELEKDTPRLLCLLVKSSGSVSRDVQKHVWTLAGIEAKSWKDEECLTLSRKPESPT